MKKSIKALFKITFVLSSIALSTSTAGILVNDSRIFSNANLHSTNQTKSITTEDISLNINNRNNNQNTPYGVINISGTKVRMVSFFNIVVWEYDLASNTSILKQISNAQVNTVANNFSVKYNPFTSHVLVYGTVTTNGSNKVPFLFQINSETGLIYYTQANSRGGILSGTSTLGVSDIFDCHINSKDGTLLLIAKTNAFSNNGDSVVKLINSINYNLFSAKFTGLTTAGFTYNASKSIQAVFEVSEDVWGFTLYTKNTGDTKDKCQYFLFDNNLNYISKSDEIEIGDNTRNRSTSSITFTSAHSESSIAVPIILPVVENSKQYYYIVDASVVPIEDPTYTDAVHYGTNYFRVHKFYYDKIGNNHTLEKQNNTVNMAFSNVNYAILSLGKDVKNNILYALAYQITNNSKIDFSKYILLNLTHKNNDIVCQDKSAIISTDANVKTIPSFNVVNANNISNTYSWFVLQEATYGSTNHSSALDVKTTIPSKLAYKRGNNNGSNSLEKLIFPDSWNRLVESNYATEADKSTYKLKLPQDVPENEIMNWVQYSYEGNSENVNYTITKTLEKLEETSNYTLSGSGHVLYNNTNGNLKAKIRVDFSKWWSNSDKYTRYIDVNLGIFNTIEKLKFILVTNNTIDSTKYTQIENLKRTKKPSEITKEEIFNNFFVVGTDSTLNITQDSISINGALNSENADDYPIKVTTNDESGILSLAYDFTSISSPSMESTNVKGRYDFTNFKKEVLSTKITLNVEEFNKIKSSKLSYEFELEDIISILNVPSIYNKKENWVFEYTNAKNTEEFYNNLINGTTAFTIKYTRDEDVPSEVQDDDLVVTVNTNDNGSGCKKISEVVGNKISFDANTALSLTGSFNATQVNDNIGNLLRKTIEIQNEWFNSSEIKATVNLNKSNDNNLVYDLTFNNNEINSNIKVFDTNGIDSYYLVFNETFMNKLKQQADTANLFDLTEITFQYNLVKYDWNFGISSQNPIPQIDYKSMLNNINDNRILNNLEKIEYEFLLPSQFVNKYKNNWKLFNELYPLISPITNKSNNLYSSSTTSSEYFEIEDISFIDNDALGTVNVRYNLFYKNLGANGLRSNAEIVLTNFKTLAVTNNNYFVLIIVVVVIVLLSLTLIPVVLKFRRGAFLNKKTEAGDNNNLSKKINKVITQKHNVQVKTPNINLRNINTKPIVQQQQKPINISIDISNPTTHPNIPSLDLNSRINKPIIVSQENRVLYKERPKPQKVDKKI